MTREAYEALQSTFPELEEILRCPEDSGKALRAGSEIRRLLCQLVLLLRWKI